ncbi:hypothetical protein Aduo_001051 [Ancylostoma duodenale]
MTMIRQLKSLKQARDDARSLRNTLNDVEAIIATLRSQGETVDTTHTISMIMDVFPKRVQDEIAKKEFDSGKEWNMEELLSNITMVVRRHEHLENRREPSEGASHPVFNTQTRSVGKCVGCKGNHWFQDCPRYQTPFQKVERLKALKACWKCFSLQHHTKMCRRSNCPRCNGYHNAVVCREAITGPRGNDRNRFERYRDRRFSQSNSPLRTPPGYNDTGKRSRSSSPDIRRKGFIRYENRKPIPNMPNARRLFSKERQQNYRVRFARSATPPRRFNVNFVFKTEDQSLNNSQPDHTLCVNSEGKEYEENSTTRLMTVPIRMWNNRNGKMEIVYGILDSASDQSFIRTDLVERMMLPCHSEKTIMVTTFGGRAETKRTKGVNVNLYNSKGQSIQVRLLTHPTIMTSLDLGHLPEKDEIILKEMFPRNDQPIVQENVTPEILIGNDYFNWVMKTNEPVTQLPSGLFVTSTFFGPVISGTPQTNDPIIAGNKFFKRVIHSYTTRINEINKEPDEQSNPNPDYSELWKLPGVGTEELITEEEEFKQVLEQFCSTVEIRDGKIYVCFPWKANKHELADNYNLALSRLHQLYKMKDRNPDCWKEYCKIIQEQYQKKFIEDAVDHPTYENPFYYIPHQAVIKMESETTKTRIVLDASSKRVGELSLNDVIFQGPLLLPNLIGILLRSRIGTKVMIADVEKAFHMIHLHESERNSVRFLWLKDTSKLPTPDNVRIVRFCRLPFGVNASPFLLGMSIKYGLSRQKEIDSNIYDELERNLYVDNVLMTDESTESFVRKYHTCKRIFSEMSMNLRQFLTSDSKCNQEIKKEDLSTSKSPKILGILWNPKNDKLSITCKLKYCPKPTKRKVLQYTHATFDPLGYLIPLLVPAKIYLQDLWKRNRKWDDLLTPEEDRAWQEICENAAGYVATIPRSIAASSTNDRYELHTFTDASLRSFAAAVYLRTVTMKSKQL